MQCSVLHAVNASGASSVFPLFSVACCWSEMLLLSCRFAFVASDAFTYDVSASEHQHLLFKHEK
jgi:hypothetical protein